MTTSIEVNKKSVKQLLESGKRQKFVIPEYQRPYAWSEEQAQTLFDDLVEYTVNDNEETYFLGTIVSYENNSTQEIIDGQQRITTLFLLLRALYTKLSKQTPSHQVNFQKSQIEPAIWAQDEVTGKIDFDKILISSEVMGDDGNQRFTEILKSGRSDPKFNDNYSKNYILFQQQIEEFPTDQPMQLYAFISNILNRAILLPITADSQDTALTIFSTLNDRGLALSDADIFKAKIYNHLDATGKNKFIEKWKRLDEDTTQASESIQKLFYYYMFYLRALENDRKTTTPGIRKYYSRDNFKRLYQNDLMDNLNAILSLWIVVNNRTEIDESWSKNIQIKQTLDELTSYPNEFWKYPVVIFYLKHHFDDNFDQTFLKFLRHLLAALCARYIVTPTINAAKRGILNLNAEIVKSSTPKFDFSVVDENELKEKIKNAHRNTVRMILKILAYQQQDDLLPRKWEIEHILPQKWQSSFFPSNSDKEVKELVEHIGNKIPFEKRLNIIASNGYFEKKQESYAKTKIQILLDLSATNTKWGLDEIRERDMRTSDDLVSLLNMWGLNENEDESEIDAFQVKIPVNQVEKYNGFTNALGLDDSDGSRREFLDLVSKKK
ncbi:DUF262 domain-containing protein [Paucilactobacillus wasatchensis]|uniref:DUF262 domain-containing protein n=1 Tax=Paucilactobacillus wasatchensis TaxID=1335616 RepID=A0A0D1A4B2_9LACO|nr:DUF262 domain-containing protein [Paucilactobacillus wasatchensis]KIS02735.1 hypothetical protein WDC_1698 [Paucilactobacillus wasatchensis]